MDTQGLSGRIGRVVRWQDTDRPLYGGAPMGAPAGYASRDEALEAARSFALAGKGDPTLAVFAQDGRWYLNAPETKRSLFGPRQPYEIPLSPGNTADRAIELSDARVTDVVRFLDSEMFFQPALPIVRPSPSVETASVTQAASAAAQKVLGHDASVVGNGDVFDVYEVPPALSWSALTATPELLARVRMESPAVEKTRLTVSPGQMSMEVDAQERAFGEAFRRELSARGIEVDELKTGSF